MRTGNLSLAGACRSCLVLLYHPSDYFNLSSPLFLPSAYFKNMANFVDGRYCSNASMCHRLYWVFISNLSLSYPAWCLYHPNLVEEPEDRKSFYGDLYYNNNNYVTITESFLGVSYVTRLIQLFPTGHSWMRTTFRATPSNLLKRMLLMFRDKAIRSRRKSCKTFRVFAYKLLLSVYCLLKATADLYASMLWEVLSPFAVYKKSKPVASRGSDHLVIGGPCLGHDSYTHGP